MGQVPLLSKFNSTTFRLLVKVGMKLEEDKQLAVITSAGSSQAVCHMLYHAPYRNTLAALAPSQQDPPLLPKLPPFLEVLAGHWLQVWNTTHCLADSSCIREPASEGCFPPQGARHHQAP